MGEDHTQAGAARRREASMREVAALAGVSGQTVSRVANGRTNVDPDTRARVLDAMRQLGYRPNAAARALRSGRFRTIGVITFSLSLSGSVRTIEAVAAEAARRGYALSLMPLAVGTPDDVARALERLQTQSVDGVIVVVDAQRLDASPLVLPSTLPVVLVDSTPVPERTVVDNDQARGARLATDHLLDLGHASVHHLSGPADSIAATVRVDAWRAALAARGITASDPIRGDWTAASGHDAGVTFAADPAVTAIFAANDQMALGVLRALREAGRRVPEDVSVVGFDDMPEAADFSPPLTTVRQDFAEIGRTAVDALVTAIEREPAPGLVTIPTTLVLRSSTAPAPSA